jgi:hypothetical protein
MLTVNGVLKDIPKDGGSKLTDTNLLRMDEQKLDATKRRKYILLY